MRSRSRSFVALAACVCALALFVPSLASTHHIPFPVAGAAAVVGNSQSNVAVCVATANVRFTPSTSNLLGGTVVGQAISQCTGTLGLLRAYVTVEVYQGTILRGSKICEFYAGPYTPTKQYPCTASGTFTAPAVLRVVTHQAYRLQTGSWVTSTDPTKSGKDCFISNGDPTGAYCDVDAIVVG